MSTIVRSRAGRLWWRAPALIVAAALLTAPVSWSRIDLETTEELVEMPNIEGADVVTGESVALADLKGSVVVVDLWATWCPPCVKELPDLVEYQEEHKEDRFTYVGISLDAIEDQEIVKQFTQKRELNYPVIMGNREMTMVLGEALGRPLQFVPTKVVIDRTGHIAFFFEGSPSAKKQDNEAYEARLAELLAQPIPEEYQTAKAE